MGGRGHSDHSEGKEVSDGTEKAGSDGSEGSEASEKTTETGCRPEVIDHFVLYQNNHLPQKANPFRVFEF